MAREPDAPSRPARSVPPYPQVDPPSLAARREPTTRINRRDAWMAYLRSRVMAGNGRWLHACHCCDAGAPSAPWGAWSWPGRPLSNVSESWPSSHGSAQRGGIVGCWGGPNRHLRQVPDVLRTGTAACPRLARPRSFDIGDQGPGASSGAIPRSRTRRDHEAPDANRHVSR
jgi:hypothetical protein